MQCSVQATSVGVVEHADPGQTEALTDEKMPGALPRAANGLSTNGTKSPRRL